MNFSRILILMAAAFGLRLFMHWGKRRQLLLAASVLALFWLQPQVGIRTLNYWLPVMTLVLVSLSWIFLTPTEERVGKENTLTLTALLAGSVLLALSRYVGIDDWFMAAMPPAVFQVLPGLLLIGLVMFLAYRFGKAGKIAPALLLTGLLILFVGLKTPQFSLWLSEGLRWLNHQNVSMARAYDINWLGYSYIAFRLMHTIRDRQNGRLKSTSLMDYMIYVIFYPALPAGPIDRIERFGKDLSDRLALDAGDVMQAGERFLVGLFKKFVLADSLAMMALTQARIFQIESTGWMWLSLIAYSFMIYFDFSGYTDIAIGIGRMLGVQLPENFKRPYLQQNLSKFWNNWHITLTMWFRAYFYNTLTRYLRKEAKTWPTWLMILIPQLATMLLIGLWHGITWPFALWGLWHGVGSFVQNRWSDWSRRHNAFQFRGVAVLNTLLTFLYVSLGWVFFLSENTQAIGRVFLILLGRL
jgi:alginate O-acetyltransferase complex protein AlgI